MTNRARRRLPTLIAVALTAASGPILAQVVPPLLIGIDTSGSETSAFALPSTPLVAPVTQLRLRFDQPLPLPIAGSPINFRVMEAGPDGLVATANCTAPAAGDDRPLDILAAQWDDTANEVALRLDAPAGLARGNHRVIVCQTLPTLGGLALRDFVIGETPRFSNPGFDTSADGWTARTVGLGPVTLERAAADADGAVASGSLRVFSHSPLSAAELGNGLCVDLTALPFTSTPSWRMRLRYRVVHGNVRVVLRNWFGFTGDAGETGCDGPGISDARAFTASASSVFSTFDTGWQRAPSMPLATASIYVVPTDGGTFEILFDDMGFSLDSQVIFRDDFRGY